jgi:hypothetical protein
MSLYQKNKIIVTILITIFTCQSLFAGHSENQRSRCRSWAKRFAANSHLAFVGLAPVDTKHHGNCDNAFTLSTYGNCGATASSNASWSGLSGSVNGCGGLTGGLNTPLSLLLDNEEDQETISNELPSSSSSNISPIFNANSITFSDIKIELKSPLNSILVNDYNVIVWKPTDDAANEIEDSDISSNEIIEQNRVFIQNGTFRIEGNLFSIDDFDVISDGKLIILMKLQ